MLEMRHCLAYGLLLAASLLDVCNGNTEKIIFLGPETVTIPATQPTLDELRLDILTPNDGFNKTKLPASFPTTELPLGAASWLLVTNLTPNQRYEVRVCWSATVSAAAPERSRRTLMMAQQPTIFSLDVFEMSMVWDTPELITSLASYAFSRHSTSKSVDATQRQPRSHQESAASLLFLRVSAAADYFTDDEFLMAFAEPVNVNIVLDPYVLNAVPQSLFPVVSYIIAVTVMAYFLSKLTTQWIRLVQSAEGDTEKKQKAL
ncbi:hypothetical protein C8035_v011824 [Colletotrichum spinosum]|uniref:Uncharacterized protein n=1 Tax=Colletotrichum spinosum TaxID=1347390 RepID=A0A4R8PZ78_9PEZI|nr:hypothetical protein C8035_v011824 [Colletotrichum spinosum]